MTTTVSVNDSAVNAADLSLNLAEAVNRIGDAEIHREIAHYFAANIPESLSRLEAALGAGSLGEATRLAHSMKGNCATVGAEKLRENSFSLEKLCHDGELGLAKELFATLAPKMLALREILLAL